MTTKTKLNRSEMKVLTESLLRKVEAKLATASFKYRDDLMQSQVAVKIPKRIVEKFLKVKITEAEFQVCPGKVFLNRTGVPSYCPEEFKTFCEGEGVKFPEVEKIEGEYFTPHRASSRYHQNSYQITEGTAAKFQAAYDAIDDFEVTGIIDGDLRKAFDAVAKKIEGL